MTNFFCGAFWISFVSFFYANIRYSTPGQRSPSTPSIIREPARLVSMEPIQLVPPSPAWFVATSTSCLRAPILCYWVHSLSYRNHVLLSFGYYQNWAEHYCCQRKIFKTLLKFLGSDFFHFLSKSFLYRNKYISIIILYWFGNYLEIILHTHISPV